MFTIEDSIGTAYHMVVMIAMAAYTFYIFINAIVRTVKAHRRKDRLEAALCNISFASAVGAMLALTRLPAPTLAVKSHRRNDRPVLIAVSTNDALASSAQSIGALMGRKGVFFVPFEQDDYRGKPTSCVADFERILPAAEAALEGRQLQPMIF